MDLVGFDAQRFTQIEELVVDAFTQLSLPLPHVVPVAARDGDNLARRSERMPWYRGPTLLDLMLATDAPVPAEGPLRLPIQDVYRFDQRRVIVGRVESGILKTGDTLLFSPSARRRARREHRMVERPPHTEARAGEVVGFTLDAPAFVERGDVASHLHDAPTLATEFRAHAVWLGEKPLAPGDTLLMKVGTAETTIVVQAIEDVFDLESLRPLDRNPPRILRGEAGWLRCESRAQLARLHAAVGPMRLHGWVRRGRRGGPRPRRMPAAATAA